MFSFVFLDNVDLGTACGKYFRVSCLSIVDPGKATKADSYVCVVPVVLFKTKHNVDLAELLRIIVFL